MNKKRVYRVKQGEDKAGPVVYWMSRDQRARDNWALFFAQELALEKKEPFMVVFVLVPQFLEADIRHYGFMIKGLQEVKNELAEKNIPFFLLSGSPDKEILQFIRTNKVSSLVADFDPLRIKRLWKQKVLEKITIPFYEVDAHNIVPCRIASPKPEYAAYTFRPKIHRALPEFLEEIPPLQKHPRIWRENPRHTAEMSFSKIIETLSINGTVAEITWLQPGYKKARRILDTFIQNKLESYSHKRNDPTQDGQSHLSPYLHFGQISAQRAALEIQKSNAPKEAKEVFLEELIVRRELSDNFCFYNPHYDTVEGFPSWAQKSLSEHRKDPRRYLYSSEKFEKAETHDALWNAAQMEMVKTGKMHGYMRMYWAKKLLEWTGTYQEAFQIALFLNNKYELDGRDPNGYAGVAWSIGGVHDRAWPDRPVFGKIRYMSRKGCESKFNVKEYIQHVEKL